MIINLDVSFCRSSTKPKISLMVWLLTDRGLSINFSLEFFLQQWLIIPSLSQVEDENALVILGISVVAGLNLVSSLIDDSFNKFT